MRILLILLSLLFSISLRAEPIRYINDNLQLMLRAGPGNEHDALGMIAGGSKVELLEVDGEFARVRTSSGKEGWLRNQYLSEQTRPAKLQDIIQENQRLLSSNQALSTQNQQLNQQLAQQHNLVEQNQRFAADNQALQSNLDAQTMQLKELLTRNQQLSDKSQREWFLFGGGVSLASLLLGLLLGLMIARLKKRRWGEL